MIWILSPIIVLLVLAVRAVDVFPPRFWAEDLPIFVHAAQWDGAASIIHPYAGYLHFIPRIIAYAGTLLPVEVLPEWFLGGVLLVTAWCAAIIARSIGGFTGIAASLALVLASGWNEPIGSITNLQWLTAPTLLVLSLRPATIAHFEGITFAVVASLTGPFSVAFGPIFAFQSVRSYLSSKSINWVALIALFGGVIQFLFVVTTYESTAKTTDPHFLFVFGRLLQLAAGNGVSGIVVFLLIAGMSCLGRSGRIDRFLLIFAVGTISAMAAAKFQYEYQLFASGEVGQRYWYIPSILLMVCAAMTAKQNIGLLRWLAVACFVAIPLLDIANAGWVRHWNWTSDNWKRAVAQSYIAPVGYKFAPDWLVTLKDGSIEH